MALGAVTELEVFAAVKARIVAAAGWFTGVPIHFGRRAPNAAAAPYVVVAVEEQDGDDIESDGAAAQRFLVEIAVRSTGPEDAESAAAALVSLDPRWNASDPGLTLTDTDKKVNACQPRSGRLRLIEKLKSGKDQYIVSRRWVVWTSAFIGT